ncbi:MAG: phosphoribosylformylglycinamidine synthase, partial [Oscillospiraceae bacterium]|nr:phosphoribosylformylglycinamidine synthase [Oscillospiraceae bacterium]
DVEIEDERVRAAFEQYGQVRREVYGEAAASRPVSLMDIATLPAKLLKKRGQLPNIDESPEINACTVRVKARGDRSVRDWLLYFKNETHNHPTEIEPFGGAATCLGGGIRDPLSGRSYVYQAMRLTGAGDPRTPIDETLQGKLPQRKITQTAAEGYSTYGNQIGLASGLIKEIYHPGYVAKRMECGALVGAAKVGHVRREKPIAGDVVVLIGGRTGRDGVGGATGSSTSHEKDTVTVSAAEVQKGDANEERKIVRLFRKPEVMGLIKKCNDFGAGGVSVAIGELADGIEVNLDAVPTKYHGLDGTELAISESQERMAVVVASSDLAELLKQCELENVEATQVAVITEEPRLVIKWRGKKIIDIARTFLDTNGAKRYTDVSVAAKPASVSSIDLSALNETSQKGLIQRFDASAGGGSVFMTLGGKEQLTENQVMAAIVPCTPTLASLMAYGFDPYITEADPFGGSAYAVVNSVAKIVAAGADLDTIHLSLQEYFPRLGESPERWGQIFAAMLGAFSAQVGLKIAAIGGKDSMSGSFGDVDVPPTLIAFACGTGNPAVLVSNEFKAAGNPVYKLELPEDYGEMRQAFSAYGELVKSGKIVTAAVYENASTLVNMARGNNIGVTGNGEIARNAIVFEANEAVDGYALIGHTAAVDVSCESLLEDVFPSQIAQNGDAPTITDARKPTFTRATSFAKPKATIAVIPGTNCEIDTVAALERAGGGSEQVIVLNRSASQLAQSLTALEQAIKSSQMLILPGGYSGGEEPGGSAKFMAALLGKPALRAAIDDLFNRDGLILGIGDGFGALLRLGLLCDLGTAALTTNLIGRHQAGFVNARVASTASPWLSECNMGEVYAQPVSYDEGRFVAEANTLETLKANGQIALQYVDFEGKASMDVAHNPGGSQLGIAAITSADGRVMGTMLHSERYNPHTAKNITGEKFLPLFEGGVRYFI